MKTLKVILLLCIMLGFAVNAKSQGKQVERPLKGSFFARVVETYPTTEVLSITGIATHFGIVRNSEMTMVRPTPPPPLVGTFSGIMMAANGDYVNFYGYSNMTITTPPAAGTMTGKVYITSGTGRFTGCTGEAEMTGTFDMVADWAMFTLDGSITY
ncbi:MAG: hypothetical protein JW830_13235 [Bacteroidales bacterium]|nr:hypothetical protein [Bacteroidales bacterium]